MTTELKIGKIYQSNLRKRPFFRRLYIAFRYLFNMQTTYDLYEETIIDKQQADKLINLLKKL